MCSKARIGTIPLLLFCALFALFISGCNENRANADFSASNSVSGLNSAATLPPTTLTWDAPTTYSDGSAMLELKEYRVYFSNTPNPYSTGNYHPVSALATSIKVRDVISQGTGTYYFVVTAVATVDSTDRESDPSNEVSRYLN